MDVHRICHPGPIALAVPCEMDDAMLPNIVAQAHPSALSPNNLKDQYRRKVEGSMFQHLQFVSHLSIGPVRQVLGTY